MSSIFIIAHFGRLCKREEIKCRMQSAERMECKMQSAECKVINPL